jgi:hypothetical protein
LALPLEGLEVRLSLSFSSISMKKQAVVKNDE